MWSCGSAVFVLFLISLEVLEESLKPWTVEACVSAEINSRKASDAPAEEVISLDRVYVVAASLENIQM